MVRKSIKLLVSAVALSAITLVAPPSASAASLVEVTGFGNNPGNLRMHVYAPDSIRPQPAIVVAMHGCGGNGPGFHSYSGLAPLADSYGFVVVYPSASKKGNCFDAWSDASKRRDGGSDPVSIASMTEYAINRYNGDRNQVYVTGSSSGGMETNVMLALYPDVFKAGAAFMGVPFACFPNESDYVPVPGASNCASGRIDKTPQEWANLVTQAYPGYSGPRPRVQLWHGAQDNLVYYRVLQEEVEQWTAIAGASQTPVSTDQPEPNWRRERFGTGQVEAITITNAGHSLPSGNMASYAVRFFGISG